MSEQCKRVYYINFQISMCRILFELVFVCLSSAKIVKQVYSQENLKAFLVGTQAQQNDFRICNIEHFGGRKLYNETIRLTYPTEQVHESVRLALDVTFLGNQKSAWINKNNPHPYPYLMIYADGERIFNGTWEVYKDACGDNQHYSIRNLNLEFPHKANSLELIIQDKIYQGYSERENKDRWALSNFQLETLHDDQYWEPTWQLIEHSFSQGVAVEGWSLQNITSGTCGKHFLGLTVFNPNQQQKFIKSFSLPTHNLVRVKFVYYKVDDNNRIYVTVDGEVIWQQDYPNTGGIQICQKAEYDLVVKVDRTLQHRSDSLEVGFIDETLFLSTWGLSDVEIFYSYDYRVDASRETQILSDLDSLPFQGWSENVPVHCTRYGDSLIFANVYSSLSKAFSAPKNKGLYRVTGFYQTGSASTETSIKIKIKYQDSMLPPKIVYYKTMKFVGMNPGLVTCAKKLHEFSFEISLEAKGYQLIFEGSKEEQSYFGISRLKIFELEPQADPFTIRLQKKEVIVGSYFNTQNIQIQEGKSEGWNTNMKASSGWLSSYQSGSFLQRKFEKLPIHNYLYISFSLCMSQTDQLAISVYIDGIEQKAQNSMCDTTSQVNPQVVIAPHYFDSAEILIQASSGSQALQNPNWTLQNLTVSTVYDNSTYQGIFQPHSRDNAYEKLDGWKTIESSLKYSNCGVLVMWFPEGQGSSVHLRKDFDLLPPHSELLIEISLLKVKGRNSNLLIIADGIVVRSVLMAADGGLSLCGGPDEKQLRTSLAVKFPHQGQRVEILLSDDSVGEVGGSEWGLVSFHLYYSNSVKSQRKAHFITYIDFNPNCTPFVTANGQPFWDTQSNEIILIEDCIELPDKVPLHQGFQISGKVLFDPSQRGFFRIRESEKTIYKKLISSFPENESQQGRYAIFDFAVNYQQKQSIQLHMLLDGNSSIVLADIKITLDLGEQQPVCPNLLEDMFMEPVDEVFS